MLDDFRPRGGTPAHGKETLKKSLKPSDIDEADAKVEPTKSRQVDDTLDLADEPSNSKKKTKSKKWWHIFSYRHTHLRKWQWALLTLALLLAIVGGAFGAYKIYQHFRKLPAQATASVLNPPKPTTEASRLTGVQVDPELNKRPVTGVMIENSPDARPQSGLINAGIVFEAIAEGGITRFLALYQDAKPDYIGPVRSARPYYLDWALAFDASLAHVGGSPDALAQIKALHVRDLDQFANAGSYTRVSSRFAPHNVYTSTDKLDALNQRKGYTSSSFTSWARKPDKKVSPPNARIIDLSVSGFLYSPHYEYDSESNSYKRSEGGKPHTDERSGKQLSPKVVVVLVSNYSIQSDGIHSNYVTIGTGHMYVFQDGTVTEGTWQKSSHNSQFTFTDSSGAAIRFNAGQTWVTMVAKNSAVTYKP